MSNDRGKITEAAATTSTILEKVIKESTEIKGVQDPTKYISIMNIEQIQNFDTDIKNKANDSKLKGKKNTKLI